MLLHLIEYYQTGSVLKHEEFSEKWVKDRNMTVGMHHRFVKCYRDPASVRCEYEDYVSVVDKRGNEFLHEYVRNSAKILSLMPYPKGRSFSHLPTTQSTSLQFARHLCQQASAKLRRHQIESWIQECQHS